MRTMDFSTVDGFMREATLGGPGLDGYAYNADVYCEECAYDIMLRLAPQFVGRDGLPEDSNDFPQPIFFGEPDCAEHCADCGEHLYGEEEEGG